LKILKNLKNSFDSLLQMIAIILIEFLWKIDTLWD